MSRTKAKLLAGAVSVSIGILGSQLVYPLMLPSEAFPKLLTQEEAVRVGAAFVVAGVFIGLGCTLLLSGIRERFGTRNVSPNTL